MARVSQTTQALPYAGLEPTMAGPTSGSGNGDIVDVGRTFLMVLNGSGGSITVTILTPETVDGDLAITDRVVTVANGAVPALIPLNSVHYKQTATSAGAPADVGRAYVEYSAVTSVTRAVVSL